MSRLSEILLRPAPGMANASDVLRLERQENRLCELICGVLVEKRLGYKEMSVAAALLDALQEHVKQEGARRRYRTRGLLSSERPSGADSVGGAFAPRESYRGEQSRVKPQPASFPQFVAEITRRFDTGRAGCTASCGTILPPA